MKPSTILKVLVPVFLLSLLVVPSFATYDMTMKITGGTQGSITDAAPCLDFNFTAVPATKTSTPAPHASFAAAATKDFSKTPIPAGTNQAVVVLNWLPDGGPKLITAWQNQEDCQVVLSMAGKAGNAAAGARTFTIASAKIRGISFFTIKGKDGSNNSRISVTFLFPSVSDSGPAAGSTPTVVQPKRVLTH
jgi:hypothetical protein